MLAFKIHGENSAASLYLWELTIQCQIAELAFDRLQEAARVQLERDYTSKKPHPETPVELFADCAAFLSALAIIAKLLFAGIGSTAKDLGRDPVAATAARRSKALRTLLALDALPALRSLGVRNAFEHIDERLDRLLREHRSGDFVWLHLTLDQPASGFVLKRFDPHRLTLSYLDQELDLERCHVEVLRVRSKLNGAYNLARKHRALLDAPGVS